MKVVKARVKACERLLSELENDRLTEGEMKIILKYHLTWIVKQGKIELKEKK